MFLQLTDFPRSFTSPFFITSPKTPIYNCIAYAYGDFTKFYWPADKYFFWPKGISKTEHLKSFIELFESIGYKSCNSEALEAGFEKVAIFGLSPELTKHAARQLPNGQWSSKLGANHDVSHTIFNIEGGVYGSVQHFMKRPIKT